MKTIVLVDDVAIANFIMKKMVSTVSPGAMIYDFISSKSALDSLAQIKPDLIFLDLNMPDMDGFQFLNAMKDRNLHYKVIILSSSTSDIDKQQASVYKNVIGYHIKPLEKEPLQKILASL